MSPHGLGLTTEQCWGYTPREHKALVDVHRSTLYRWAADRADFHNAHFRGKDTVQWMPEDFLGEGKREERQREMQRSMLAASRANAALSQMKKGDKPEGLPSWATGE